MRSLLKFISIFVKSVAKYGLLDSEMRGDILKLITEVVRQTFQIIKTYEEMSEYSCVSEFLTLLPNNQLIGNDEDYFSLYIKPFRLIFSIYLSVHYQQALDTKKLIKSKDHEYINL